MSRELSYAEAILEATDQALHEDSKVMLLGLGVPDPKGIFGTTLGLQEKYGEDRVFDTPTAENGVTGVAIGAALTGMRPIITHQRVEFSLLAIEQLINQAAKWFYMTGGKASVPLVVRSIIGRGWGQGPQHSQSLESWFAHVPGIKVIMPSNPYDAKGLLTAAVRDNNPVVMLEHRWLHNTFGPVPEGNYEIEIGKAKIAQKGDDITIVSYSYMMVEALRCASILAKCGINAEVIDLRSIRPLDESTILKSVSKTGRLLTIDNGWSKYGIGSEIVSLVAEKRLKFLKSPPIRVGPKDVPIPSTRALANLVYPSTYEILKSVEKSLGKELLGMNWDNLLKVEDTPDKTFQGPF